MAICVVPGVDGDSAVFRDATNVGTKDYKKCQAVIEAGNEYAARLARDSQPIPSGSTVNVTADIFVGAVLVLCVALGWIAGGQR